MRMKKNKPEDLSKLSGTEEKVVITNTPSDRMKEIAEKMQELKDFDKLESEPEPELIIQKHPKIIVKENPSKPLNKKDFKMKVNEEQLNALVYSLTQGAVMVMDKEDMRPEETKNFSAVLYEIGEQQGWWYKVEFLPYLILIGASVELGLKIYKKPSKHPQKSYPVVMQEKIMNEPQAVPTNAEIGKVDIIDQDKLVEKLGGGRFYKLGGSNEEN
jgi:hypothetical protein